MNYRELGRSGIKVSEIGLGTWQLGDEWGPALDDETAEAIITVALDRGINFIDTADLYGQGLSEQRVGTFIRNRPRTVFVATKLGLFPRPGGRDNFSLEVFRRHTEASLLRLRRESLDLTQLHCIPSDILYTGEPFDWLRTLQTEGKIRHFGASVESMDEALYCLEQDGLFSLQIIFNVFRQKPIDVLFERAQAKGVALIVRLPLASGLLADKFTADSTFDSKDHRHFNRDGQSFNVGETFAGLPFEKGIELVRKLRGLCPLGMTVPQLALRWILDHPAVGVVIPGARSAEQVIQNAGPSDLPPLPVELHRQIRQFYALQVAPHIRGKY